MALVRNLVKVKRRIKYKPTFDYITIVILTVLICFGLIMIFSASYYTAEEGAKVSESNAEFFFLKQLLCVGLGLVCMIFLMFFDYHNFIKFKKIKIIIAGRILRPYSLLLGISIVMLILVLIPGMGHTANGSSRWLDLKFITIQPSEVTKAALILFFACSIGRNPRKIKSFAHGLLPYLMIIGAIAILIIKQPNFSAIICMMALVMVLLFVGGARLPHMGIIVAVGAIALVILFSSGGDSGEYRDSRLDNYLNPLGYWQTRQSLYSIGSGGMFGRGLGQSMQKFGWLPFGESDFIFAIIVEEVGFIGAIGVIAAFGILIWRSVVIAMKAPDLTGLLLAAGVAAIIAIQVIVNIGVVTTLLPPTGVILPFISYGGSAVMIFMAMTGILLNVSRQGSMPAPVGDGQSQKKNEIASSAVRKPLALPPPTKKPVTAMSKPKTGISAPAHMKTPVKKIVHLKNFPLKGNATASTAAKPGDTPSKVIQMKTPKK